MRVLHTGRTTVRSHCILDGEYNLHSPLFRFARELAVDTLTLAHRPVDKGAQQLLRRIKLDADPPVEQGAH